MIIWAASAINGNGAMPSGPGRGDRITVRRFASAALPMNPDFVDLLRAFVAAEVRAHRGRDDVVAFSTDRSGTWSCGHAA